MAVCKTGIDSSILYGFSHHSNQKLTETVQGRKNPLGFRVQRIYSIVAEKAWWGRQFMPEEKLDPSPKDPFPQARSHLINVLQLPLLHG